MRITSIASAVSTSILLVAGLAGGAALAAPSTVYVSNKNCSDSGPGTQRTPYCTIQKGLDSVAGGGTVRVDNGTYPAQITFNKNNVTLKGNGNNTVIQNPASATGGNIVDVNAKGITILDATVSGPFNSNSCASTEYGVFFENNSSATIQNSQIVNVEEANQAGFGGCQQGVGVRVGSKALGIKASATLTNDKISGYQKGGVVVDGPGSSATIKQSKINGGGPTSLNARNGIQISRGATGTVAQNNVSGNEYTGDSGATTAAGILIYDAGAVAVRQNIAPANDMGIDVEGSSNGSYGQNIMNKSTTNGIFVEDDNYTNPPTILRSQNNSFTQNSAHGTSGNNTYTPYDMQDTTTGSGTLGTANTWHQDTCKTSSPALLCKQ